MLSGRNWPLWTVLSRMRALVFSGWELACLVCGGGGGGAGLSDGSFLVQRDVAQFGRMQMWGGQRSPCFWLRRCSGQSVHGGVLVEGVGGGDWL